MGTYVLTPDEMRKIDRWTIKEFGIPGFTLMESAGRGIVDIIESECDGEKVIVCAGGGNNGGDGFVVARYLLNKGYKVLVVFTGDRRKLKGEAKKNFNLYKKMGGEVVSLDRFDIDFLKNADIIVDAIFGTGFRGQVEGKVAELIDAINQQDACVVSVDIPSGINGLTGEMGGTAVIADFTGTMAFPKRGLLLYPGRLHAGEIYVIDIGVPYDMPFEPPFRLLDEEEFYLPFKMGNEHKGKNGKLLVISGSMNYTGAPQLVADAALRTGAGLVYLAVRSEVYPQVSGKLIDPVVIPYKNFKDIERLIVTFEPHGVVFGPGVGRSEDTINILKLLLSIKELPLLIDADGVWALSRLESIEEREHVAITPHPGEASFLLNVSPSEIDRQRFDYALKLREITGFEVALKGNPTILATSSGNYVNILGNEGLGKGGSGDVLSGLIGGFAVQTGDLSNALLSGVFLHALLGDILYEDMGGPYYVPHDLIGNIHRAIEALND